MACIFILQIIRHSFSKNMFFCSVNNQWFISHLWWAATNKQPPSVAAVAAATSSCGLDIPQKGLIMTLVLQMMKRGEKQTILTSNKNSSKEFQWNIMNQVKKLTKKEWHFFYEAKTTAWKKMQAKEVSRIIFSTIVLSRFNWCQWQLCAVWH